MVFGREHEGEASGTEVASLAKPLSVPYSVLGREAFTVLPTLKIFVPHVSPNHPDRSSIK